MDNLRQLLVAIAALTLLFSAVSGANPNYFLGYSAFAEDGEDEEDDNSGSSTEEKHDDSDRHDNDDSEYTVGATLGANSTVELEIDDYVEDDEGNVGSVEAELEIEIEDGDLPNGEHAVLFSCLTPDVEKLFDGKLLVAEGDGDFQGELFLVNGTTYKDCSIDIGGEVVYLPEFTVNAGADDDDDEENERDGNARRDDDDEEEDDDEEGEDDDDEKGRGHHGTSAEVEDGELEIEVEKDTTMADGTYNVTLMCAEPEVDMTIVDSLTVKDGKAKFDAEIELEDGTYNTCKLVVGEEVLATFDSLTVSEDDDDDDVEEKRKEKRRDLVSTINSEDEHRRRVNANPASTGDFSPGWNYTLNATGAAIQFVDDEETATSNSTDPITNTTAALALDEALVEVNVDMAVWKSNKALILLSVLNGTVEVDGEIYNVELGYALYSVNHDVMRLGAFVSDESGNIYKLKLRGYAEGEDAAFPMASGESVDMEFEGNAGPARNSFSDWELELQGTIKTK